MLVGVPKEIKDNEYRVAMTPAGVKQLIDNGHDVLVQQSAGEGSRFTDEQYIDVGAKIVPTAADAWGAEMVVKVKEPVAPEYDFLRSDLLLFTYLHLAAEEALTKRMVESGVTGVAYETVEARDGSLPLLTPMSEVAGRMAIQVGAHYLETPHFGRGMLLGGVAGVPGANVVVIGGGIVGTSAAYIALGMDANVTIMDTNLDRLRFLEHVLHGRLTTIASNSYNIAEAVQNADLVVGAVLIKGARAPKLVSRDMISNMRDGSVVVDVGIHRNDKGKLCGDVRSYELEDVVKAVSPVPGGVGPMTIAMLLENTLQLAQLQDQGK